MSTLHLPEGYQYKFYPARRTRHQHVLEVLSPHIPTITLGILALTLLQWHAKSWSYRRDDVFAYISCPILYNFSHPLLSLCLAVSYTTWASLPGSFASLNLPLHAKFLSTTTFASPPHASEEKCMVCWEEETPLASLPCNHKTCKSCLLAMGQALQTACPLCKHPLYSMHDKTLLFISKATLSIQSITVTLHFLIFWDELQHLRYWNIAVETALMGFLGWLLVNVYLPLIEQGGQDWWRLRAGYKGGVGRGISTIGFSCLCGVVVLVQTVYNSRGLFLERQHEVDGRR